MTTAAFDRRPAFWVAYAALALAALFVAARLFPLAIPLVNLDIRMTRADAIGKGAALKPKADSLVEKLSAIEVLRHVRRLNRRTEVLRHVRQWRVLPAGAGLSDERGAGLQSCLPRTMRQRIANTSSRRTAWPAGAVSRAASIRSV